MGRDILFYRVNHQSSDDSSDSEEDEDTRASKKYVAIVSLGAGDAWPCYLRPLFVAGYRRMQALGGSGKALDAILDCCPPSHNTVDNSRAPCGFRQHSPDRPHRIIVNEINPPRGRQRQISEISLFKAENQLLLDKAGLWPCVELLLMHDRCDFATPTIRRVSEMMQLLKEYIPYDEKDLEGTPCSEGNDDYNVADDRSLELVDAFAMAAAKDDIVAEIG